MAFLILSVIKLRYRPASIAIGWFLALLLTSCAAVQPERLSQYRNTRYGFEFAYPSRWQPIPPPDNFDGQAFQDPDSPETEIRGWARQILPKQPKDPLKLNFTTDQGLQGELQTEIGREISTLTLTLRQGAIQYIWQARSPNDRFAEQYRLFYNIARQYRVFLEVENSP